MNSSQTATQTGNVFIDYIERSICAYWHLIHCRDSSATIRILFTYLILIDPWLINNSLLRWTHVICADWPSSCRIESHTFIIMILIARWYQWNSAISYHSVYKNVRLCFLQESFYCIVDRRKNWVYGVSAFRLIYYFRNLLW